MTYRLHDRLIDSVKDYLYILYLICGTIHYKNRAYYNYVASRSWLHAYTCDEPMSHNTYNSHTIMYLCGATNICNMLLWKHSLKLSNSIASSVK